MEAKKAACHVFTASAPSRLAASPYRTLCCRPSRARRPKNGGGSRAAKSAMRRSEVWPCEAASAGGCRQPNEMKAGQRSV